MRACRKKNISSHHIGLQEIKLMVDKNENAKVFKIYTIKNIIGMQGALSK